MIKFLVLATQNKDKLRELRRLMKGVNLRVLSLSDFPSCPDPVENGRTFESNAKKKARAYSLHTQGLVLADDSGLMVRALNGKPGVYSARFAGDGCSYRDNNLKLLRLLKRKKTPAARRAKFVSVMALYDSGKFLTAVRGECDGFIAVDARGSNGFGYDPLFVPAGKKRTFAELSPREKNKISHRSKALALAKKELLKFLC